jgi:putative endonuclease
LVSRKYGTNYTGVTSNLLQRLYQHREEVLEGFSKKNGVKMLVWYEQHATMETAIKREKQIKKWHRQWKINLIEKDNPDWRDLAVDLGFPPARTIKERQFVSGFVTSAKAEVYHRQYQNKRRVMDSRLRGNDENE